tara:strand:- start:867 stop:1883 length:1017 start_codon:yes stop_codon:yes gene_type:complete
MSKLFDNAAYDGAADLSNLVDGSQALANKGYVIGFHHVPSATEVYFKAFITAFNETYASDWNSEVVYGRVDPIYMFKNTTRNITLAFNVPCSTEGEAYGNLAKIQTLLQFLYPTYENINSATTITQSPLVRIQVMNLLTKGKNGIAAGDGPKLYNDYRSTTDAASNGLLGAINNLSVNHNLENTEVGVIEKAEGTILPKMIEINLDFSAIHEQPLGWQDGTFRSQLFPYNAPRTEEDPIDLYGAYAHNQGGFDAASLPEGSVYGEPTNEAFSTDDEGWTIIPGTTEDGQDSNPPVSEQDAANAAARYAGLFGEARYKRDTSRSVNNDYIASAIRGKNG